MRVSLSVLCTLVPFAACQTPHNDPDSYLPREVQLDGFESVQVAQATPVWCWAACSEMILRYQGEEASQSEIAARIHGHDEAGDATVEAASRFEIYSALCPDLEGASFETFLSGMLDSLEEAALEEVKNSEASTEIDFDEEELIRLASERLMPSKEVPIEELKLGHPAVAALRESDDAEMGHVYVIIGATYRDCDDVVKRTSGIIDIVTEHFDVSEPACAAADELKPSEYIAVTVELVDPYLEDDPTTPRDEMRISLSYQEFAERVDFVATRKDAKEALTRWSSIAKVEAK